MSDPITPTSTPHIYTAIRAVMTDVRGIAKSGEMKNYRGVIQYHFQRYDDMAEKVGDAFREHAVFSQSEVRELRTSDWEKPGDGNKVTRWTQVIVHKVFIFTSLVDGSTLTVEACGEGTDSSDKATNKAETSALKNALRHGFLLSTRDEQDPDASRPGDDGRETVRNAQPESSQAEPPRTGSGQTDPSSGVSVVHIAQQMVSQPVAQPTPEQVQSARQGLQSTERLKTRREAETLLTWAHKGGLLGVQPDGPNTPTLAAAILSHAGTLPA